MGIGLLEVFICISGKELSSDENFIFGGNSVQADLFEDACSNNLYKFNPREENLIAALHSDNKIDFSCLPPAVNCIYELSANAFDTIVHAWMSELPVTLEIIRFGKKILYASERQTADIAATDRSNPDVRTVQAAAYKVWHEIHRLMGLLRFCPNKEGVYIALCEPDHFILPALKSHFYERFGRTPWAIIDNKRRLCLYCASGEIPVLFNADSQAALDADDSSEWENLWRNYHKTINNESRKNLDLQRCLMPKRYWKYLTEMKSN